jgi:hypothetical protein
MNYFLKDKRNWLIFQIKILKIKLLVKLNFIYLYFTFVTLFREIILMLQGKE